MTLQKITLIVFLLALTTLTSFQEPDFVSPPKIKLVTEWRQWADTLKYHEPKWLKSKREYYSNGALKRTLFVEYEGDTTDLRVYKLNNDSTLKEEICYNKYLKKWMKGDIYYYEKGGKLPYMSKDKENYKCYYTYNALGRLIARRHVDDRNKSFAEHSYTYDSAGLLIQEIEYDFFDGERDEKRIYVYEYEMNSKGQIIKRNTYFVPPTTKEKVVKTDRYGNRKITYQGDAARGKTITEEIFFNLKGERIKKIEYDRDNKPQFIWTYQYEYYP